MLVFTRVIQLTFWMNLLLPVPNLGATLLEQSSVYNISLAYPSVSPHFTAVLVPSEISDALPPPFLPLGWNLSLSIEPFPSVPFSQIHRLFCLSPRQLRKNVGLCNCDLWLTWMPLEPASESRIHLA